MPNTTVARANTQVAPRDCAVADLRVAAVVAEEDMALQWWHMARRQGLDESPPEPGHVGRVTCYDGRSAPRPP